MDKSASIGTRQVCYQFNDIEGMEDLFALGGKSKGKQEAESSAGASSICG